MTRGQVDSSYQPPRSPGRAPLHVQSGQGVPTDVQHFRPVVERDRISSARIDHDRQSSAPRPTKPLNPFLRRFGPEAVDRYNAIEVNGTKREFPVKELLGAESIMARFHWGHTCSHSYTPLELGEWLSKRSFTSTGTVNYLATKNKKASRIQFDGDTLQTEEDNAWEPRSLWSVVDGLNAVRWCHVLFEVGEEQQIHKYFDEMVRRARQRPNKIEVFREYYSAVAWSFCMALRIGKTFHEATEAILQDSTMWNE